MRGVGRTQTETLSEGTLLPRLKQSEAALAASNRQHSESRSLWLLSLALIAANTGATEPPSRNTVFASFHGCLVALETPSQEPITSPCADTDASALIGASREAILSGLGNPSWCTEGDALRFITWSEPRCDAAPNWGYSFYRLHEGSRGGGPELLLEFGPGRAVKAAKWLRSK